MSIIPLKFGLFWGGQKLSYLRYLTFKSLRHFHPHSKIELYVPRGSNTDIKWGGERQDFMEDMSSKKDYLDSLNDLNVDIKEFSGFDNYPPNYQSDFFRWWWLKQSGGFYLDTDQIIVNKFDTLPLDQDLIYTQYENSYTPVGVIGASSTCEPVQWANDLIKQFYDPDTYNSIGPDMFRHVLTIRKKWNGKLFNAPPSFFYPVNTSNEVGKLYNGEYNLNKDETYAIHWFGGFPLSQRFNMAFSENFAKNSNDSISKVVKELGII